MDLSLGRCLQSRAKEIQKEENLHSRLFTYLYFFKYHSHTSEQKSTLKRLNRHSLCILG